MWQAHLATVAQTSGKPVSRNCRAGKRLICCHGIFRKLGCCRQKYETWGEMSGTGATNATPIVVGMPSATLYHRLETPTQTVADARKQVNSMEVWGTGSRLAGLPSIKAYRNALPATRGIEFSSPILPHKGSGTPYEARWYLGDPGVIPKPNNYVAIAISYIKNMQVP